MWSRCVTFAMFYIHGIGNGSFTAIPESKYQQHPKYLNNIYCYLSMMSLFKEFQVTSGLYKIADTAIPESKYQQHPKYLIKILYCNLSIMSLFKEFQVTSGLYKIAD